MAHSSNEHEHGSTLPGPHYAYPQELKPLEKENDITLRFFVAARTWHDLASRVSLDLDLIQTCIELDCSDGVRDMFDRNRAWIEVNTKGQPNAAMLTYVDMKRLLFIP